MVYHFIDLQKALVRQHTRRTKSGKITTVKQYIDSRQKKEKQIDDKKKSKKKVSKNPWIVKYGHLKLSAYPTPDVKENEVKVDLSGDINSHFVLSWFDKNTKVTKHSYTPEFFRRNRDKKWKRIAKLNSDIITNIKEVSKKDLLSEDSKSYSGKLNQLGAITYIIANTGLRVGTQQLFRKTGNRGVITLSPDNVSVKGDTVYFDFIGKSYQQNKAELKDADLANYISKLKKQRKGQEFLFDVEYKFIRRYFKRNFGSKFNIKDMRTYVATDLAKNLLFSKKLDLENLSKTKQKRVIKNTLKEVSEQVSEKLNNTPNIAKKSYIHPNVQLAWLKTMSNVLHKDILSEIEDKYIKKAIVDENRIPTLDEIIKQFPPDDDADKYNIDEDDFELCDEYDYVIDDEEENNNKSLSKAIIIEREEDFMKAKNKSKKDEKIEKIRKVMREFKEGKLKSSSGHLVTNRKQAIAIALSEAGLSKKSQDNDFAELFFIDISKSNIDNDGDKDLGFYIDIEKAKVHSYQRKTKSGKIVKVKDYNRRDKIKKLLKRKRQLEKILRKQYEEKRMYEEDPKYYDEYENVTNQLKKMKVKIK